MEMDHTTPVRKLRGIPNNLSLEKTPPTLQTDRNHPIFGEDSRRGILPDGIKAPKPLHFTERYTSPTDRIISPISKGLLARNKKAGAILSTMRTPPKDTRMFSNSRIVDTQMAPTNDHSKLKSHKCLAKSCQESA